MELRTIVHKVDVPILAGESIHAFLAALEGAVRAEFTKKEDDFRPHMVEVFSNSLVFANFEEGSDDFFATRFERDAAGEFSFGSLVEVVRINGFRPKPPEMPTLTKSIEVSKTLSNVLGIPYFGTGIHLWFDKSISAAV